MFFFIVKRFCFYVKLVLISLFRAHRDKTAPLTLRRIIILVLLNTCAVFVWTINWLCLMLDEIIYPDYRNLDVVSPVFTLGVPRSGSTLFQRLVARDEKNFTSTKLWEILFAPSIIQRKFFGFLGVIDRKLNGLMTFPLRKIDKWLFASSRKIHQVGLYLHEEDGVFFIWIMSTFFCFFAFPFFEQFTKYLYFDDEMPDYDKKYIMRYYKRIIQRHLYYHGPEKTYLSKNPTFAPMVKTLKEHFPDAIFINTIRTPYQQVPSINSLLVYFIGKFGGDFMKIPDSHKIILEFIKKFYIHPVECLKTMDPDRYAFVLFDDMVHDLGGTIRGIYSKFRFEMNGEFEKIIDDKVAASKNYRSGHKYTLEQFGFTPEVILEQYKPIFEEFNFEKEFNPA